MPSVIQNYLKYSRYLLLIISLLGVASIVFENINGYGTFMGVWMNGFVMTTSVVVMFSFLLISIIFERPFCNYFCFEAVKFGVVSMTRIFSIKRNNDKCINCKKR